MYDKIIKMHEEGKEIADIIVELNTTYKRVKRAIDAYEEDKKYGE